MHGSNALDASVVMLKFIFNLILTNVPAYKFEGKLKAEIHAVVALVKRDRTLLQEMSALVQDVESKMDFVKV